MKHLGHVVAIGLTLSIVSVEVGAQPSYEAPAVLRAADVASPQILQSPVYTIDQRVTTDGLLTKTVFHSSLGEFAAEGPGMAAVRATEIQALDILSKTESSEIFQKALQASLARTGQ